MKRPVPARLAAALALLLFLAGQTAQAEPEAPATAADQTATAAPAGVAELESLSSMLKDPAQRDAFVARLDTLIEQQRGAAGDGGEAGAGRSAFAQAIDQAASRLDAIGKEVAEVTVLAAGVPALLRSIVERGRDPATLRLWLTVAAKVALVLLAGMLVRALLERVLRRPFGRVLLPQSDDGIFARLGRAIGVAFVTALAIAAFAAAGLALLPLLEPRSVTRLLAHTLIYAYAAERLVSVISARLLVPDDRAHRIIDCSDDDASYFHVWTRRLAVVAAYGYALVNAAGLFGLPASAHDVLARATGLLLAGLAVVIVLQNRVRVSRWLQGNGEAGSGFGGLRRILADTWFAFAIIYIVGAWAIWTLGTDAGFRYLARATVLTLLALAAARLLSRAFAGFARRAFSIPDDLEQRFPGLEVRVNRYVPLLGRLFAVVVYLLAALVILDAWGLDMLGWLRTDSGLAFVAATVRIGAVLLVALLAYEALSLAILRYLDDYDSTSGRGRARTLLPLMRTGAMVVILVVAALIVLSELGLDITPLLAGAGVFGLAIGFGAQSLVRDLITGIFILIEDAISIGDVVEVGGRVGIVEKLSIRTIHMRDLEGTVHSVPFGEVTTVSNMTKDFSFALMDIGVAYREDVDEVIEVLCAVAEELREDEAFSDQILEPLEVLGLDSFGDSAVTIRIRLKTRPIKQWGVKREYQRRLKRRFDELDIEIPFPHQTLYFGVDKEGKAPPGRIELRRGRTADPEDEASDAAAPENAEPASGNDERTGPTD